MASVRFRSRLWWVSPSIYFILNHGLLPLDYQLPTIQDEAGAKMGPHKNLTCRLRWTSAGFSLIWLPWSCDPTLHWCGRRFAWIPLHSGIELIDADRYLSLVALWDDEISKQAPKQKHEEKAGTGQLVAGPLNQDSDDGLFFVFIKSTKGVKQMMNYLLRKS